MMKYAICVALLLVGCAFARPTGQDDAEQLPTTENLQMAEPSNKPALGQEQSANMAVDPLHLPLSTPAVKQYRSVESVHEDSETPSPDYARAKDSELANDILGGKKAVVMVEIFKPQDNDNDEAAARIQRSAAGIASNDKEESTTATAVNKPANKFIEKTESSSQDAEEKNVSSGGQGQVRSFDADDYVRDEDSDKDDMSVAETIIFRPLFSYRQDTAARRRYFRDVSRSHPGFDYY